MKPKNLYRITMTATWKMDVTADSDDAAYEMAVNICRNMTIDELDADIDGRTMIVGDASEPLETYKENR